jgi:hypothetical protein
MAAKKCQKCGKTNPHFFTHCVECGAKLDAEVKEADHRGRYLMIGLVLCVFLILITFIALPAVRYSMSIGQNFSEAVSAEQTGAPMIESSLNRPVGNNNLQITISSARDGQNTYDSNKFFLVSIYLKNTRETGNILVSSSDFVLADSEGTQYFPYSMGSKVTFDLNASQGTSTELTFVIPQNATAKKVLFTFPETSAFAGNRHVVTFII